MNMPSLNEKQKDHCATVLNAVALAQFGAIGFVAYTGSNYFQAFYSAVAFVEMEFLALLMLSNFPPSKWWAALSLAPVAAVVTKVNYNAGSYTPIDLFAAILYASMIVLSFAFVFLAQRGNQHTDLPKNKDDKVLALR